MTTPKILKTNFKNADVYWKYSDSLKTDLANCSDVFDSAEIEMVDNKYAYRGKIYFQMLKFFLGEKYYRGMIDEALAVAIGRDLRHLIKTCQYMGMIYMKLKLHESYTRIKMPKVPYALYTFKCRMPNSNWYGGKCIGGKNKPNRLRTGINQKLQSFNLPYSGVGEYSLENIAPSGSPEDWRSILHFHYVVPFLSMTEEAVIPPLFRLMSLIYQHDDDVSKDMAIDQLDSFLELSTLPDMKELNEWWTRLCLSKKIDLVPISVHRQDKDKEKQVLLDKDGYGLLEQNYEDWERMDKYCKKDKFLQWHIDHPKQSLECREKDGKLEWFLLTHYNQTYRHRISPKLLMDHYRNVKTALPHRARNSFAIQSHPLHKLMCRHIPFSLSDALYRKLLTRKDSIINLFNF